MGLHRLLAVATAVVMPVMLLAWVELVSIDQSRQVEPGAGFEASIDALGHQWEWPPPYETAGSAVSDDENAWLRLGVLVPQGWRVNLVSCQVDEGKVSPFSRASPEEVSRYEELKPAPDGYEWQAFGPMRGVLSEGTRVRFRAEVVAGERTGVFRVGYMTWQGPVAVAAPEPVSEVTVDPSPSYLETSITVGPVGPPPRVVKWDPEDGAADVPLDTDVRVSFSRDMDVDSLRNGGVQLYAGPIWYVDEKPVWRDTDELYPGWMPPPWPPYPAPIQVFFNAQTRIAVLHPLNGLMGDTVYSAMVTRKARSSDGVPLEAPSFATFLTQEAPWAPVFLDVPFDHRFREAIEALARIGVAGGFPDGTYRPETPVTRAQLAVMLLRLLGVHTPEPDPVPAFSDIGGLPDETVDYLGEADRAGIVEGFLDGSFRPNGTVTRIQMVRMVVRAAQGWLNAPPPGYNPGFTDVMPLDLSYVSWASYNRLVDGKAPGHLDPWSAATRGHASRVLFGVWQTMPQPLPAHSE